MVMMDVVQIYTEVLGQNWHDNDTLPQIVRSGDWDRVELMAHLGPAHWLFTGTASSSVIASVLQHEDIFVLQRILNHEPNGLVVADHVARQDCRAVTECFLASQGAKCEVMVAYMKGVLQREEKEQPRMTAQMCPFLTRESHIALLALLFERAKSFVLLAGLSLHDLRERGLDMSLDWLVLHVTGRRRAS